MGLKQGQNLIFLIIAGLLAAAAGISLGTQIRWIAWLVVVVVDAYLIAVLPLAARRAGDRGFATRHAWIRYLFPGRATGVFFLLLTLAASVMGFAGLYVGADVFPCNKGWLDATYISLLTLGFSDFGPKAGYGQRVVIFQLASGVLLLIGAFPLLISRISTFADM